MEEELRCFLCRSFYHVPVLLGCHHALCLSCAINLQKLEGVNGYEGSPVFSHEEGTEISSECDKVSVVSDADSGVSSSSSRPTSIIAATEGANAEVITPPTYILKCPQCDTDTFLEETGAKGLPRYRVLAAVVDKYLERFQVTEVCQICDNGNNKEETANPAQLFCDQCLIFYCLPCKDACHPIHGPLTDHWFVSVAEGRSLLRARRREIEGKCAQHPSENVSMYCSTCRLPVCLFCLHNGRHHAHNVHALNAITKTHKTELSQSLQHLSERARSTTAFIHTLKSLTEEVQGNCRETEGALVAQIDAISEALQERRIHLISWLRSRRDAKVRVLREQVHDYTETLQSTTGAIHFCIEALKESDPASFMEAHEVLKERIENLTESFLREATPEPRVDPTFDFSLDDKLLSNAISQLTFVELKPPGIPSFIRSECSAVNNSVTVCWAPQENTSAAGYLLEIDDGDGGHFKEVYNGSETVCTIDGLHFDSIYRVKIRAFNGTGISQYSEPLRLQTSKVAFFTMQTSHPDIILTNDGSTIRCDSFEHRVSLGTVGFSRGTHYWQFVLDKYDGNADIAIGVAKNDVNREKILGQCENSLGMYIDSERCWLVEGGNHLRRIQGGVNTLDTIGVLLSFSHGTVTFYVNKIPRGCIMLNDCTNCVLYPAVSLNRSVTLTLQTELPFPDDFHFDAQPETDL